MTYRVTHHFTLKNGAEKEAIHFLEQVKERVSGPIQREFLYNEKHPTSLVVTATWSDLKEAKLFAQKMDAKEKDFIAKFCKGPAKVEVLKLLDTIEGVKGQKKKAA